MSNSHAVQLSGSFNGRELTYQASLDLVPVNGADGQARGNCSVFSYVAEVTADERARRPVAFFFNGGPGAASCFLHLGGIGPQRVAIPENLQEGMHGPYLLEDSAQSCFDVCDLVFIDPINTGYGRSLPDANLDSLYSVEGDAQCFADIIRDWLGRYDRWDAPKYIGGESYGTQRAVFLANALMGFDCVPLDGIVLLGQAVNVQETADRPGNVTSLIAGLPYKAATAWFHGLSCQGIASVEEVVELALAFAHTELAQALMQGNVLDPAERARIADRLAYFTGVKSKVWLQRRFWMSKRDFRKELLRDRHLWVSGFDSRYTMQAPDEDSGEPESDASVAHLFPGYTAACARYFRDTLQIPLQEKYAVINMSVSAKWDWSDRNARKFMQMGKASPFDTYPYVAGLTGFMRKVPQSRLFIGTGQYDGLTTVGAVAHLLRQYDFDLARVTERRYPAGHMMYTDRASSDLLNAHLRAFFTGQDA